MLLGPSVIFPLTGKWLRNTSLLLGSALDVDKLRHRVSPCGTPRITCFFFATILQKISATAIVGKSGVLLRCSSQTSSTNDKFAIGCRLAVALRRSDVLAVRRGQAPSHYAILPRLIFARDLRDYREAVYRRPRCGEDSVRTCLKMLKRF